MGGSTNPQAIDRDVRQVYGGFVECWHIRASHLSSIEIETRRDHLRNVALDLLCQKPRLMIKAFLSNSTDLKREIDRLILGNS